MNPDMDWNHVETRLSRLEPPFPHEAVEEARRRWDEWAPRFIAVIERISEGGSPFLDDDGEEFNGLFCFVTWLAAEKRDARAYAPLVRACHCSPERAEELFGDDLTGGLDRMLASVCDGDLSPLKALAEDEDAAVWCRVAALFAMNVRVVEGDDDRDEMLAWMDTFCTREADRLRREGGGEDDRDTLLTWAVGIVGNLGPAPLMEKIRGWFGEGLIDPTVDGLPWFEAQAAESADDCLAQARGDKNDRYVRDVVAEMEWWACFREETGEESDESDTPEWLDRLMPSIGGPNLIHGEGTFRRDAPKVSRNDPCPCGSGKKFKKCCGKEGGETINDDNGAGAVRRSIDWLMLHHGEAVQDAILDLMGERLDEDDAAALNSLDKGIWQMVQVNAFEWLLAEGEIWNESEEDYLPVSELLLGPDGPPLSPAQGRWIEQLATRPLRFYEVTETVPGVRMTLCDVMNQDAPPVVVSEKSGSLSARVGMKLAARIVEVGDHHELSGAVYPFSNLHIRALKEALQDEMDEFEELQSESFFDTIWWHWLMQYLRPAPLPMLVDTHSGDLLMFVTDRYRVLDWAALAQAVESQEDIDGDREDGWSRIMECEDGMIRRRASITPSDEPDMIEVSYRTQHYADEGRTWFEALAGNAVEFVRRDIQDPKVSMMLNAAGPAEQPKSPPDLPPEAMAGIIEATLLRIYARWADEPIPALGNKTPRQAIATAAGLERVKGLLRSYEENERRQAAEQGRREISLNFLWASLGLRRS